MELDDVASLACAAVAARLQVALGDPRSNELSYRSGLWQLLVCSLQEVQAGSRRRGDIPRAVRNSGISLKSLLSHGLHGFRLGDDDARRA